MRSTKMAVILRKAIHWTHLVWMSRSRPVSYTHLLRLYELFVGPPEQDAEWDDRGIEGVSRFLNRFWNLVMDSKDKDVKETKEMIKLRHKLVYDIEQRFNQFSLNTVISGFMEYNNKLMDLSKKEGGIDKETLKTFVILLAPFAPHICLLYTSNIM